RRRGRRRLRHKRGSQPPPPGGCALTRRVLEVPAVVNGCVAGGAFRRRTGQLDPVVLLERQRRDEVKVEVAEVLELQLQQDLVAVGFRIETLELQVAGQAVGILEDKVGNRKAAVGRNGQTAAADEARGVSITAKWIRSGRPAAATTRSRRVLCLQGVDLRLER